MLGVQPVETRSWPTDYTGPLAIHASRLYNTWSRRIAARRDVRAVLAAAGLDHEQLVTQAIVGTVRLVGCCRVEEAWARLLPAQRKFGDFRPGRFAWVLADPVIFPEPIFARGLPGLWTWEPPAELQASA